MSRAVALARPVQTAALPVHALPAEHSTTLESARRVPHGHAHAWARPARGIRETNTATHVRHDVGLLVVDAGPSQGIHACPRPYGRPEPKNAPNWIIFGAMDSQRCRATSYAMEGDITKNN